MNRTVAGSVEEWNDPTFRGGQRVSWTAPVCEECWTQEYGDREPVRVRPADAEVCAMCGTPNRSGIYRRISPAEQVFKSWEWLEP